MNVRDKSGATQTPQTQANSSEADRKLLAAIRRAVVGDKTLSKSAHNVKIVTKDGVVTLKAENEKYAPIIVAEGEFRIAGKVVGLLRKF